MPKTTVRTHSRKVKTSAKNPNCGTYRTHTVRGHNRKTK